MTHNCTRLSLLVALLCATSACSDSEEAVEQSDTGTAGSGDGACVTPTMEGLEGAPLIGAISVQVVGPADGSTGVAARDGYSAVTGKVADKQNPQAVIWEEQGAADDCTLYTPRVPFCETPCTGSDVCVADNVCETRAVSQDAGEMTVVGVATTDGVRSWTMSKVGATYQPVGLSLAYPPFGEGDTVTVSSAGSAAVPAFTMHATGVSDMVLGATSYPLVRDTALELTWTPPSSCDATTVAVLLDISHHGQSKGKVECRTADDGEMAIAPALVTQLLDLGVSGYPTVIAERQSRGSVHLPNGNVELVVESRSEVAISIDGLVSCNDDSSCPEGTTCQSDLVCR